MNTLALRAAGVIASATASSSKPSLLHRLLAARETQARRRVVSHLAAIDDQRLAGLGFTPEDIAALRAGNLRLPR